jgi:hypothetical protein
MFCLPRPRPAPHSTPALAGTFGSPTKDPGCCRIPLPDRSQRGCDRALPARRHTGRRRIRISMGRCSLISRGRQTASGAQRRPVEGAHISRRSERRTTAPHGGDGYAARLPRSPQRRGCLRDRSRSRLPRDSPGRRHRAPAPRATRATRGGR